MALLNSRHNEKISDGLKLAILVSMVPLEFQNLIMQHGSSRLADMKYNVQRDYLLNLAEQKLQMKKPSPIGVNNVNDESDWENSTDVDSWNSWYDPSDIDFVGKGKGKKGAGKGVFQCYACGEYGHIAKDCPRKGLGKGKQLSLIHI